MNAIRGFLFYVVFAITVIPTALTILITWPVTSSEWRYDHVGIVWKVEDGIIYTVEGNSGDSCRVNQYPVCHYEILGYGIANY